MKELLEKLEKATEGANELDEEIASTLMPYVGPETVQGAPVAIRTYRYPDGSVGTALRYTRSIDAALSLVPEGHYLDLHDWTWTDEPCWNASLCKIGDNPDFFHEKAATPALALCIAGLRAREAG